MTEPTAKDISMQTIITACPECKTELEIAKPREAVRCSVCGNVFVAHPKKAERTEAEEMFLSGSSFLALGEYKKAAELFLDAAKLSPSESKNWLYLLCAITERFKTLYTVADGTSSYILGKRKVIFKSVYNNFISTAKAEDYVFAKSEFDIDLRPSGNELWCRILDELLTLAPLPISLKSTAAAAYFATEKLRSSHPQLAKRYYPELCKRLNPIKEGVLEINTLVYYPESPDGVLRIDTDADSIEFESDKLAGAERFTAFLLTRGIENIGSFFPFRELVVDKSVTEIPERLMSFCSGLRRVTLSDTVRKIGADAFYGCVSLSAVAPLDKVEQIGDRAFFGTAIRTLELPDTVKKLGSEVIGAKKNASVPIEKYLIELDAELAQRSTGFNAVGEHSCGYITRKNGKFLLSYPQKCEDGAKKPLNRDEKRIFEALACISMDSESVGQVPKTLADKAKSIAASVIGKFKRKN